MQTSEKSTQLAPQILMRAPRGTWLLTALMILLFLSLQRLDLLMPIPFLLLMITVAISGALAGAVSGTISGLLMSGYIIYAWAAGFGPEPLTGTILRALLGCTVSIALGTFLGVIRDQLISSYSELQIKREELALFGDELATRVRRQTRDLESAQVELRRQQERLQNVTKRWIDAQEIERRNLARELHDDVGQILTALRINLDSGRRAEDPESSAARLLAKSTTLVDTAIDSVRQLSLSLRPSLLDDLGFTAAIREHSARLLKDANIDLDLTCEGDDRNVSPETGITAFRTSQEAISNVLRHSEAHHVSIHIRIEDGALCVEIGDDGKGFNVDTERNLSEHFGLASMRERTGLAGGSTFIESELGGGTSVRVCLPLEKKGSAA